MTEYTTILFINFINQSLSDLYNMRLLSACKINYAKMRVNYRYVDMQDNNLDLQTCDLFMLVCNIIVSH